MTGCVSESPTDCPEWHGPMTLDVLLYYRLASGPTIYAPALSGLCNTAADGKSSNLLKVLSYLLNSLRLMTATCMTCCTSSKHAHACKQLMSIQDVNWCQD